MDQATTLEGFIEQLHAEGVAAGEREAEQLRAAAAAKAEALVAEAQAAAREIVAGAEAQARALVAEARTELALAARDVQLDLRAHLERGLTLLLETGLEQQLDQPALLASLLADVVRANAAAAGAGEALEVKVRPELVAALEAAAPALLGRALRDGEAGPLLRGELREAGFEYRVADAVVEVTPAAVAEKLIELVSPRLRALLRETAGQGTPLVGAG